MAREKVSEKEWENGIAAQSNPEKAALILSALKPGTGYSIKAIGNATGIKWPYSELRNLEKGGKLERKKLGKAYYYRKK